MKNAQAGLMQKDQPGDQATSEEASLYTGSAPQNSGVKSKQKNGDSS